MDSLRPVESAIATAESACAHWQNEWAQWEKTHQKTKVAVEFGLGAAVAAVAAVGGAKLMKFAGMTSMIAEPTAGIAAETLSLGERTSCVAIDAVSAARPLGRLESEMAARATQRVKDWYPLLEPRLGAHLTDPNVILTLADARGQTELFIRDALPSDVETFRRLNEVTKPHGVSFRADFTHIPAPGGGIKPTLIVDVHSLSGYQRIAAETRLPGIPNQVGDSWESVQNWLRDVQSGMQKAKLQGLYPKGIELQDVFTGARKGFPDNAVLAFGQESQGLVDTNIRFANYYACSPPNYCFSIKDAEAIGRHTDHWGTILERFYTSPEHRALQADMTFMQYRTPEILAQNAAA